MKKKPKISVDFPYSKTPKFIESPAKYKNHPISWQLSFIDNESKWGYHIFTDEIQIKKDESIIDNLSDKDYKFLDIINKILGKKFKSIDDILSYLNHNSKNEITANLQRIILNHIEENNFWKHIYPKLKNFENKTWNQLERETIGTGKTSNHSVKRTDIIREAQKRLEKLKINDVDELFVIRFNGKKRIWGIRKFSYLIILWFDLEHEICPSHKKHT
jgi:hypothetical protein